MIMGGDGSIGGCAIGISTENGHAYHISFNRGLGTSQYTQSERILNV